MKTKQILASVAITASVAVVALLNSNSIESGKSFLSTTAMTEAEKTFINFISEHRRSYGIKEEYEYRLSLFT